MEPCPMHCRTPEDCDRSCEPRVIDTLDDTPSDARQMFDYAWNVRHAAGGLDYLYAAIRAVAEEVYAERNRAAYTDIVNALDPSALPAAPATETGEGRPKSRATTPEAMKVALEVEAEEGDQPAGDLLRHAAEMIERMAGALRRIAGTSKNGSTAGKWHRIAVEIANEALVERPEEGR